MRMRCIVALLTLTVVTAACGSASPSASTAGPSAVPSSGPTVPVTVGPTTVPSSPGSSDGATFVAPSLAPDPALEAAFPTQIDGQPVTDLTSGSYLAVLIEWSTQPEIDAFTAAMQSIGIDPASISSGSANATVGGDVVIVTALRAPGGSAAAVLDKMMQLNTDSPRVITAGNLGGRAVTLATDSSGNVDYYYFNGELGWLLSMTEAQATAVLAALP